MDAIADELRLDPAEVRKRNFVKKDQFPYTTPLDLTYDSGDYAMALDKALEVSGFNQLKAESAELRKQGKLPGITVRHTYALEYGTDTIEIQADAIEKGKRVVLVDDLLATGGTMAAAITLLQTVGAVVPAAACIIELTFLEGRTKLPVPIEALLQYES